jgi:hypothetical protein
MSGLSTTMLVLGVVCIISAIVGGGLKALGYTIPVLQSRITRVLLAIFGVAILVVVWVTNIFRVTGVTATWDNFSPHYPPSVHGCDFDETYTAHVTTEGGAGSFIYRDFTGKEHQPITVDVHGADVGRVKDVHGEVKHHFNPGEHQDVRAIFVIWDARNNKEVMRATTDAMHVDCPTS